MKTLQELLTSFLAILGIPYGLLLTFLVYTNLLRVLPIPTHVPGTPWGQIALSLFSIGVSALAVVFTWRRALRWIRGQSSASLQVFSVALFSAFALGFLYILSRLAGRVG